jgi:hypothetical protein
MRGEFPMCEKCGADWTKPDSLSYLSGDRHGAHYGKDGSGPLVDSFWECDHTITCSKCGANAD